jgi:hypothetical protein
MDKRKRKIPYDVVPVDVIDDEDILCGKGKTWVNINLRIMTKQ